MLPAGLQGENHGRDTREIDHEETMERFWAFIHRLLYQYRYGEDRHDAVASGV